MGTYATSEDTDPRVNPYIGKMPVADAVAQLRADREEEDTAQ